jgi:LDH2 family malate/lactate/ureidoglycolate dehydrogenase
LTGGGEALAPPGPATDEDRLFTEGELVAAGTRALRAMGAPTATASLVAASLALSNMVGHDSHGIVRLLQYSDWVKDGQIKPTGQPEITARRGAVATVDGGWGFGQPAAQLATELVAGLAAEQGIGAVAIAACNHIGRLGEYVALLAARGQMGMAFCNSGPVVAPFGGSGRVMGTNPFAWAVPSPEGAVVLDFATSKVAEGKLKIALAEGRMAPPGCIVDPDGRPSTDPNDFYRGGALLPFGEHKGSGLSMLIELTAGLLSGMGTSCDPAYRGGNGTLLVALDVGAFVDMAVFSAQAQVFCREARRTGGGPAGADILLPGELEARALAARRAGGAGVPAEIRRQITVLADELGTVVDPLTLR